MLILSDGLRYRFPSETRIAVCPILRPVFVLWFKASFAEGTVSRDSSADQFLASGGSVPTSGVVTSATLEGDELPEAFHA